MNNAAIPAGRRFAFRTNYLVIAQSLEPDEVQTGSILHTYLCAQPHLSESVFGLDIANIDSANEFGFFIEGLRVGCTNGMRPILHIEAHGDAEEGLEFANGSVLSWSNLAALLRDVNIASDFNLAVVFGACHAASFLSTMEMQTACPCVAMIAPTDEVLHHELIAGYRAFYASLFTVHHVKSAINALDSVALTSGAWMYEMADQWFLRMAGGFLRDQCSRRSMKLRVGQLLRKCNAAGIRADGTSAKREMTKRNTIAFADMFREYFAIQQLPHNLNRFDGTLATMEAWIREARATGNYLV